MTTLTVGSLRASDRSEASITFEGVVAFLICLFVFAIPTELLIYGDLSVTLPAGALTIAVGIIGIIWRNRVEVPTPGLALLAAFVIWSTISIVWSPFPQQSLSRVFVYWELLAMSAVMTQYIPGYRARIFKAYLAGCVWGVLDVAYRYLSGARYAGMEGRFSAANTDPNYLGLSLVMGIPIACYLAFKARALWTRIMYLAYLPAAAFAIVLTGSRGAVVSAAAVAIVVCVSLPGKARVICCAALLLVAGLFILPPDIRNRATDLLPSEAARRFSSIAEELDHGSLASRRTFWKVGLDLVADHPVRGNGAAMSDALLSSTMGRSIGLHSLPLLLATDEGLIGVALFYGALLLSIPYVWRWPPALRTAMLGAAAAWIVGSCSLNWDIHKATWMLLTLFLSPESAVPVAPLTRATSPEWNTTIRSAASA
ncbi:MAG TPA: O-antigen ligase family protein [Terracidiphilus sp.]|nr:O-antigen ligase family protein [Terracidiphilus sp.]